MLELSLVLKVQCIMKEFYGMDKIRGESNEVVFDLSGVTFHATVLAKEF